MAEFLLESQKCTEANYNLSSAFVLLAQCQPFLHLCEIILLFLLLPKERILLRLETIETLNKVNLPLCNALTHTTMKLFKPSLVCALCVSNQ